MFMNSEAYWIGPMELKIKRFNELSLDELYKILKLRVDVFVVEQNCPYEEIDDNDQQAIHVWLEDAGKIMAYLRVMDKGVESEYVSIGRVVASERRKGFGTKILEEGIKVAKDYFNADLIYLEAQVYTKSLYEKHGFEVVSNEFDLDGIPHVKMIKKL